ncbi:MAG TPA: adenylyl-sulfate kinase, partial [Methylomirabilota bacterium]|nr:adenylyl-sulfate kinase [Methylomirabilota bacterium]
QLGVEPRLFIPIAAKHGDNIASPSTHTPWWKGPTVVQALDDFHVTDLPTEKPLRFPVQDVYRFDERRIIAGRVESGTLKVGDHLLFSPSNKTSTVRSIERWSAPSRDTAGAGESIGITLSEQIFVERGAVAALEMDPPYELTRFKVRLFWLGRQPFKKGKQYKIKLATQETGCEIADIERVIDASTLATVSRQQHEMFVGRHEVGELTLHTKRPLAFDVHADIVPTGRFVIVDGLEVAGGGIIAEDNYPKRTSDALHKSENIYWSHGKVTAEQRALRNGHPGRIVWLTGLSGAGKSTIATELERELFNLGKHAYLLDGDNFRHGLGSDLGFSPEDRKENIRRVGEVAKLFADAGFICITAFISPYRGDRDMVRAMVNEGRFIEVYVNAPVEVCEQRDPKGLYARARANEIKEFTGVSAPYEAPLKPDIELNTDRLSAAESVAAILDHLQLQNVDTQVSI